MRFFILITLILQTYSVSAANDARIVGFVTGDQGAVAAFVLVRDCDQIGSHNWETQTGADGKFEFKVSPGCYDVFISAPKFHPYSKRIHVNGGSTGSVRVRIKTEWPMRGTIG